MKRLHILYILALSASPAMAQLDNSVEVTNTVKPTTTDVKKVEVKAQAVETKVKQYKMNYAVESQPLNEYEPEFLGDYSSEAVEKGNKSGYVHAAGGTHGNVDVKAAYKFGLSESDFLTADFMLKGFNGTARYNNYYNPQKWNSRFYENRAALRYDHYFEDGPNLFVTGAFGNQVFNYMNFASICTDKQHNVLADFSVGITPYKYNNFSIEGKAKIDFFNQEQAPLYINKAAETILALEAEAAYEITPEHSVGLGVEAMHSNYSPSQFEGITHLHFTPHYKYTNGAVDLKLGLFVGSDGDVAPDVECVYHVAEKGDLYVAAYGYETENDFRHISAIHPYFALPLIASDKMEMEAEFHQIAVKVGYRFSSNFGLSGDINAGFGQSKNHLDYNWITNAKDDYVALAKFDKSRRYYINADFTYAYKDILKLDLRHQFNGVNNKEDGEWVKGSYLLPTFEMKWKADTKIIKDLYFGLDFDYACYTKPDIIVEGGKQYKRPATVNLGASVRYTLPIDLPLSVFVKGDNLLNHKHDRYFGYRALGTNVLMGFALSF